MKNLNKFTLFARLAEIREACAVATSTEDTNINMVIEEIDRLASICMVMLSNKKK